MERIIENCFWTAELILYLIFVSGDIWHLPWYSIGNELKYSALLLCLFYTGYYVRKKRLDDHNMGREEKTGLYALGILGGSVVADFFLLFTDWFIVGILFFAVVQGWYRTYFWEMGVPGSRKSSLIRYVIRMYGCAVVTAAAVLGICLLVPSMETENLAVVITAVFYGCCLIQNTVSGVRMGILGISRTGEASLCGKTGEDSRREQKRKQYSLSCAIVLLFLCDIHVGLYNLSGVGAALPQKSFLAVWSTQAEVLMWFFYLPSQLCVVKSVFVGKVARNTHKV